MVPWTPEREKLNSFLRLDDLVKYRDKVIDKDFAFDFVACEFENGQVLLIYPWVEIHPSMEDIQKRIWPGARLQTEKVDNLKSCRHRKKWWQFWR